MDELNDNLRKFGEKELRMLFNRILQTVDHKYKSGSDEDDFSSMHFSGHTTK